MSIDAHEGRVIVAHVASGDPSVEVWERDLPVQQFGTENIGLIGAVAASVMEWLVDVAALVVAETADSV